MDKPTSLQGIITVQAFQANADFFMECLANMLAERLLTKIQSLIKPEDEVLLSPKETCNLFSPKVSIVTLASWEKQGFIKKHRIGARTYYKRSEVLKAATSLRKYQRQPHYSPINPT